jgi:type IV secretion system protein TrbL
MMGFTSFFANFVQIAVLMVSWLLVLIAFFILAVQLFVTLIEFKLTTLAGFILIPFALFNKTAFLAEKVLGNIVASGVKVMVLAVIVGIGTGLFSQFTQTYVGGQPTIEQALSVVLAALAMLGLGIFGPGIATGLVSGAPQLGAGAAVGTGLAVAGTAMAGAGALGLAGRGAMAAASGSAAAARGGAAMAGGASSAYSLASAGRSGASGIAAGLGGVARAAASSTAGPMQHAASRMAGSMSDSFKAGARSSFAATGGSSTAGDGWSGRFCGRTKRPREHIRCPSLGTTHEAQSEVLSGWRRSGNEVAVVVASHAAAAVPVTSRHTRNAASRAARYSLAAIRWRRS